MLFIIVGIVMCRIIALASHKLSPDALKTTVNSFITSSEVDPYLARLYEGTVWSHDDGWGFAALGLVDDRPTLAYHRSLVPIFHGSSRRVLSLHLRKISEYPSLYLIMHTRKASWGEPYGIDYVHPFVRTYKNSVAWFVHNGGADKKALAEKLNTYPWTRADSELLGQYIADNIHACVEGGGHIDNCAVSAYSEAREYIIKGAGFNTALMWLDGNKIHLYLSHWVREPYRGEVKEFYSVVAYNDQITALASTVTLRNYLPSSMANKTYVLEPGLYKIGPGSVLKLSSL
ncbi:MAG: class II glutamine amidotransferase [Desulfurococcaceae archaeon]